MIEALGARSIAGERDHEAAHVPVALARRLGRESVLGVRPLITVGGWRARGASSSLGA